MNIKLPKTLNDCDLLRLAAWAKYTAEMGDVTKYSDKIEFRVEIVSIFSGVSKAELNKVSYRDLNTAFIHCISIVSDVEIKEPTGVIEANGQRYIFDKEIHNVSTGQVIDIKLIEDIYKNPYELMAILYIEEGMKYNEEDEKGCVKNTLNKRVEVFKNEPIGEEFLNVMGFFLSDYIILNAAILGKSVKRSKKIIKQMEKEIIAIGTTGQRI